MQITEKDTEIAEWKDKLKHTEDIIKNLKKELEYKTKSLLDEIQDCNKDKQELQRKIKELPYNVQRTNISENDVSLF